MVEEGKKSLQSKILETRKSQGNNILLENQPVNPEPDEKQEKSSNGRSKLKDLHDYDFKINKESTLDRKSVV